MVTSLKAQKVPFTSKLLTGAGMIAGLFIACFSVISLSMMVIWLVWMGVATLQQIPFFSFTMDLFIVESPGSLSYWVIEYSVAILLLMTVAFFVYEATFTVPSRIAQITGERIKKTPDHPYQDYLDLLKQQSSGPKASVYIIPSNQIFAFAISSFYGHGVVVSSAIQELRVDAQKFILAHEYAHVINGDSRLSATWMMLINALVGFKFIRNRIISASYRTISQLPVLRLITLPLYFLFNLLVMISYAGKSAGILVFSVFNRKLSRESELAADRFAADAASAEAGIHLFTDVIVRIEPELSGLFATHPSTDERIHNILSHKMKSSLQNISGSVNEIDDKAKRSITEPLNEIEDEAKEVNADKSLDNSSSRTSRSIYEKKR